MTDPIEARVELQAADVSASEASSPQLAEGGGQGLELTPAQLARRLQGIDWAFETRSAEVSPVHGLHPYPAKFVPELPRRLIADLSLPGELVADPFSGGGTAAVEALELGRSCYGIDANPIGNLLARAKTTQLAAADIAELKSLEAAVMAMQPAAIAKSAPRWLPTIPNCEKWYDPRVFRSLGAIRDAVAAVRSSAARNVAFVAFVQAASRLSYQESETRYVSSPRPIEPLDVTQTVLRELRRVRGLAASIAVEPALHHTVVDGDARDPACYDLGDGEVGLVVTSPPYPNTYDYHLYHRFRLFWLGDDPSALRRLEIGSHLKNQSIGNPIEAYLDDMKAVLGNCLRVLKPGRAAVVIVGDGLFKGETFHTAAALAEAGRERGYDHVATVDRPLPVHRRSIAKPGRRLTSEQVLVLRKPLGSRTAVATPPNYKLLPYEQELRLRELSALGGSPQRLDAGAVAVAPLSTLEAAAFTHAIEAEGATRATRQQLIERGEGQPSRRKNSTYGAHGIHRYKGKFYPQLAKALINLSGLVPGQSLVCDPFGGSGTVAVEGILNGFDAVSLDRNPLAVATSRAKIALAGTGASSILATVGAVRALAEAGPASPSGPLDQFAAGSRDELERWFPAPALRKLNWLLRTIRGQAEGDAQVVLEVLTSDLVREISQQEPRDLRIRRRREPLSDAPVYELFVKRATTLAARFEHPAAAAEPPRRGTAQVLEADAADPAAFAPLAGRHLDAVVSSPPYATALPYIDTDRLSLAAIFGYGSKDRRTLEEAMIGSREIGKRRMRELEAELEASGEEHLPASTLEFLGRFLAAVKADEEAGFRRRQAPAVLFRYFRSMASVLGNVAANMSAGACCWLVLGDSRSTVGGHAWAIPTVEEVAAIGEHAGLTLVDRLPITVTREDMIHARHSITRNEILQLRAPPRRSAAAA